MKKIMIMLFFLCVIPIGAGVITAFFGISYINPETLLLAIGINLPICIVSVSIYNLCFK